MTKIIQSHHINICKKTITSYICLETKYNVLHHLPTYLLLVYYTLLGVGININLHLCGDKVETVHVVYAFSGDQCSLHEQDACHAESDLIASLKKKCCFHEAHRLYVRDFQVVSGQERNLPAPAIIASGFDLSLKTENIEGPEAFIPDRRPSNRLYLKENRFTFYG